MGDGGDGVGVLYQALCLSMSRSVIFSIWTMEMGELLPKSKSSGVANSFQLCILTEMAIPVAHMGIFIL